MTDPHTEANEDEFGVELPWTPEDAASRLMEMFESFTDDDVPYLELPVQPGFTTEAARDRGVEVEVVPTAFVAVLLWLIQKFQMELSLSRIAEAIQQLDRIDWSQGDIALFRDHDSSSARTSAFSRTDVISYLHASPFELGDILATIDEEDDPHWVAQHCSLPLWVVVWLDQNRTQVDRIERDLRNREFLDQRNAMKSHSNWLEHQDAIQRWRSPDSDIDIIRDGELESWVLDRKTGKRFQKERAGKTEIFGPYDLDEDSKYEAWNPPYTPEGLDPLWLELDDSEDEDESESK